MNKLFNPDTSFFNNYFDKGLYLLAWRISIVFIFIFTIIAFFYSFSGFTAVIPSILVLLVGVFCLLFLHFTKKTKVVFWIYAVSGTLLAHYAMNTVLNLTHYVDFLWIMICIYIAFVGLGRKVGVSFIIFNALLLGFFFFFTLNKHVEILQPRTNFELIGEFIEVLFALFVVSYLTYQYLIFQSYSKKELEKAYFELENQNELITIRNNENILLVKEVHHRVKNNLQIITSLLRLQKNTLNPDVAQKFDEAINRIMTMALIHSKLYQSDDLSKVNIESYINDLVNEILSSLSSNENIATNIYSNYNSVGLKTIVPLGLLLNELLSNSFKHAFKNNEKGEITIEITTENEIDFTFKYSDTGTWKENQSPKFNFGLELIETLTSQMEGNFKRNESSYEFHLKNLDIDYAPLKSNFEQVLL
ncbi:MAG: sensor histidine kinase [Vicingaceae bacterium]|nr:sensor histidine kinase [Vicingaceae bacterium]